MALQKNFRIRIKPVLCFVVAGVLLGLGGKPVMTTALRQEEDDVTRRLWNKQFLKAREEAKKPKPSAQAQKTKTKTPAGAKPGAKPSAAGSETVVGELIGVTIW